MVLDGFAVLHVFNKLELVALPNLEGSPCWYRRGYAENLKG